MNYLFYKSRYGEYKVGIKLGTFAYDNSLMIQLLCENEEPFGRITACLLDGWRDKPTNWAYLEVNNMPDSIDFIMKYNLGKPVTNVKGEPVVTKSGFVYYPLYNFDMTEILKYTRRDCRVVL